MTDHADFRKLVKSLVSANGLICYKNCPETRIGPIYYSKL